MRLRVKSALKLLPEDDDGEDEKVRLRLIFLSPRGGCRVPFRSSLLRLLIYFINDECYFWFPVLLVSQALRCHE